MTQDEAIKIFNRQISDNPDKPILGIYKELFVESLDLDISDWKNIRTEKYWRTMSILETEEERKRYTLKCIWYYKYNVLK